VRNRATTLLTGAALTLLAVGVSTAAAAPRHAAAEVHKIWTCGYVATKPGTYRLAKSIPDSGDGPCITLNGKGIRLTLNSHTITGTGTDTCISVKGEASSRHADDVIVGGTKAKPAKLTGCARGLDIALTARTRARDLKIVGPTSFGVFASEARHMILSRITVVLHADDAAGGFHLEHGANNLVAFSTVYNNGAYDSFLAEAETVDTFAYDLATVTSPGAGAGGVGFHEYECSRDIYFRNTSVGELDGFNFDESGFGTVAATYNTAKGPSDAESSNGFYVNEAYTASDPASTFRTLISHNTATGFQDDFYDTTTDAASAIPERWLDNTARKYAEYGFYIYYPTKYTLTGNVADANPSGKKYAGGTTYGFYFDQASAGQPFANFSKNAAYDSEWGYYSNGYAVHGKDNVAKRNQNASHDVTLTS
jgi:hypothetical protein